MKTATGIGLCKDDTAFDRWKRNLSVPKKANAVSPLCEQYVKQREYRQKKEKYEYIEYLPNDIQWALKEKYGLRNLGSEQRTMAIHVSEKSVRRADRPSPAPRPAGKDPARSKTGASRSDGGYFDSAGDL